MTCLESQTAEETYFRLCDAFSDFPHLLVKPRGISLFRTCLLSQVYYLSSTFLGVLVIHLPHQPNSDWHVIFLMYLFTALNSFLQS